MIFFRVEMKMFIFYLYLFFFLAKNEKFNLSHNK